MLIKRGFVYRAPADGEVGESTGTGPETSADGDVIGTGNEARLALLNQIADSADEDRAEELANVNDDDSTEPFKVERETPKDEAEEPAQPSEEEEVTPLNADEKKYKLKVNGKELELTEAQLIERAQKIEAADDYLRQAAEARRRAEQEALPTPPAGPTPEELQRRQDEEDRALVRAIQVGTEEEAAAALRKLREQASAKSPALSRDDVSRTIDERLAFNTAIDQFSRDYSDVWGDQRLKQMALNRDAELLQAGDRRPYAERYAAIGDEIRSWVSTFAPVANAVKQEQTLQAKEQKKASAPKAPVAANAKTKPAEVEEEVDDSPSAVIASIAKQRGGPQWMRG